MNNNNIDINQLFKLIVRNKILRNIIFKYVKVIHRELRLHSFKWSELINKGTLLIKYNLLDQYKDLIARIKDIEFPTKKSMFTMDILLSIKYGRFHFIQYFVEDLKLIIEQYHSFKELLFNAAEKNQFNMVLYFEDLHLKRAIAINEDTSDRQYILNEMRQYEKGFSIAGRHDNIEMIKWFANRVGLIRRSDGPAAISEATKSGHLELVKWLSENRPNDTRFSWTINEAFTCGHLHILKWFHKNNYIEKDFEFFLLPSIKSNISFDCIKWVHKKYKLTVTQNIWNQAGFLTIDIAEWLFNNGYKPDRTVESMDHAAGHGRLEIVKWLHENAKIECYDGLKRAVEKEHIDVVKWLVENKTITIINWVIPSAVINGNIEILKYLVAKKCGHISAQILEYACIFGRSLEMVRYVNEELFDSKFIAYERMIDQCPTKAILKYLHQNRKERCTPKAMKHSIQTGNLKKVKYLLKHNLVTTNPTKELLSLSLEFHQFHIYFWLIDKFPNINNST